jgi:hypothetical protein
MNYELGLLFWDVPHGYLSFNHVGDRMKIKTITTRVPEDLYGGK